MSVRIGPLMSAVVVLSALAEGAVFTEGWEAAPIRVYTPSESSFIHADQGYWYLGDTVSEFPEDCGSTPHRGEVLLHNGSRALRLTSNESGSDCGDNVWVALADYGVHNSGFAVPLTANTVISFVEVGELVDPGLHGWGRNCFAPPCFDSVSLLLTDNRDNILAYVLQRYEGATENVSNSNYGDTYREIFLDPIAYSYSRNLFADFQTIPTFSSSNAQIRSIEFRVDEHGWAIIDNIRIGSGLQKPVAHFTDPNVEDPKKPGLRNKIELDASESEGHIVTYHWDFGDGKTDEGMIVTHTYAYAGDYQITLTVTDEDGLTDEETKAYHLNVPVILVHGWRPRLNDQRTAVATWDFLKPKLEEGKCGYHQFDYGDLKADGNPVVYAQDLAREMNSVVADSGYTGQFDIVCHSMGAMVSRWYMEELGGAEKVRLWIGIAPVNQGAHLADWVVTDFLRFLIPSILRSFFPGMTLEDPAIGYMRTVSTVVSQLNEDGISPNVEHKVIVGWNSTGSGSFRGLHGKTYAKKIDPDGHHHDYWTFQGDGVVALEQSKLPGPFGIDCIHADHNSILVNPDMFARLLLYLEDPSAPSLNNWPPQPDPCLDDLVPGAGNRGYIFGQAPEAIPVNVDSMVEKMMVLADWSGSDIDLQIVSPAQQLLDPNVHPVLEYWKEGNAICYVIDAPAPGLWMARLMPINVPPEGEPYSLTVFFASHVVLNLTTLEGTCDYPSGASATIVAQLIDGASPIMGANATIRIVKPDQSIEQLTLYDDGTHGDVTHSDGFYSNDCPLSIEGLYVVSARATGEIAGDFFDRMDVITLQVAPDSAVRNDWNGDGFISIIGDVPPFVNCVYFQNCPIWPEEQLLTVGDCNHDGILSIVGDVPCFVECVYFNDCPE